MSHPAIVIGSGFGGLAAAIRLRAKGHKVRILEAGSQVGGRARAFERDGFTFDAGPTVITAPYLLEELFALVGRSFGDYVDLVPVDPFYRVQFHDGMSFDYVGDEERLLEQIRMVNPDDVDGYLRMAKHAERIFDIGYTQLADAPFNRLGDMMRVVPDMIRLESHKTVYGLVSRYIKDERLRQVFTFQPLLVGGSPFRTSSIYMLIHWLERKWGVHFAKGGTTAIVKAITNLLEELDVEVVLNAPVNEIEVESGKAVAVKTEDGVRHPCSLVVSNADPTQVYKMIDPAHRRTHTNKSVDRRKQSMSLFVAYFGTKTKYEELAHHTIVLGPRYRGLLDDIFKRKILADDHSLYLHAPGRSDPSMAPPGKDAFYVLSPVPNLDADVNWEEHADAYMDQILTTLEVSMPGLRENLETCFHVDPRYFRDELRSTDGAAFGIEPTLQQSAYFRYHNESEDVGGLYFVGANTHPGAGVPGVLCSAKVLERVLPEPSEITPLPKPAQVA